jgi:hypothetical protein
MGKMFAKPPSSYLGIDPDESWMIMAVDLACAAAYWEDENYHYEKAQEKAGNEAVSIGRALEEMQNKSEDR